MSSNDGLRYRETTRIILDPPTFSPPPEMRMGYLERRRAEVDMLRDAARNDTWKPVINVTNHVTGTGAMYGFPALGEAAEQLGTAIENGDGKRLELLESYARAVAEARV